MNALIANKYTLYPLSISFILLFSVVLYAFRVAPGALTVAPPFVLAIVFVAVVGGRGAAIVAVFSSALVINYLFVPPSDAFSIPTGEEGLVALSLFVVALVLGTFKERIGTAERTVRDLALSEKLQKTLVDTISHDLKTPLTTIMGSLNTLLSERTNLDERSRLELITVAYDQAKRLNRLVTGVLEMTRLEAGATRLHRASCHVIDLVREIVTLLRETLGIRECRVTLPPGLPPVSIDVTLLAHALTNVLENAAKFSPPDAPIDVAARTEDGRVIISVADRGVGIPAAALDHIFEKFYRLRQSVALRPAGDGVGLGLAIAKGIVEAHGGRIWAEQRIGGGTTVQVSLPVSGR
jgi:two-component system, OmpR family, sensor histidine kinase KdpD